MIGMMHSFYITGTSCCNVKMAEALHTKKILDFKRVHFLMRSLVCLYFSIYEVLNRFVYVAYTILKGHLILLKSLNILNRCCHDSKCCRQRERKCVTKYERYTKAE